MRTDDNANPDNKRSTTYVSFIFTFNQAFNPLNKNPVEMSQVLETTNITNIKKLKQELSKLPIRHTIEDTDEEKARFYPRAEWDSPGVPLSQGTNRFMFQLQGCNYILESGPNRGKMCLVRGGIFPGLHSVLYP